MFKRQLIKRRLKKCNEQNTERFTIKGTFYCKIVDIIECHIYSIIMSPFNNTDFSIYKFKINDVKCMDVYSQNSLESKSAKRICDSIRFKTFNTLYKIVVLGIDNQGYVFGDIYIDDAPMSKWLVENNYAKRGDNLTPWSIEDFKSVLV